MEHLHCLEVKELYAKTYKRGTASRLVQFTSPDRCIYRIFAIYKYLRNSWAVCVARQQAARHVISKLHLITVSFPAVR